MSIANNNDYISRTSSEKKFQRCHESDPICENFPFSPSLGQEKKLWERFRILHGETRKHKVYKML